MRGVLSAVLLTEREALSGKTDLPPCKPRRQILICAMKLNITISFALLLALHAFSGCRPAAVPQISLGEPLRIGGDGAFIRIDEVLTDRTGSVFVTDAYKFTVKQFSAQGEPGNEFGTRGSGDTEFLAIPSKMIQARDAIGIIEKASSRIRCFDKRFSIVRESAVPGNIIDAACDATGRIYVNIFPFSGSVDELLVEVEPGGIGIANVAMSEVREDPALNMAHLSVTSGNELVVAHRFLNKVTLYDADRNIRKVFSVEPWAAQAPMGPSSMPGYKELPLGDLIADIAVDRRTDYLFVLGGKYSPDPYRTVQIYDKDGKWLAALRLPEKSGIFYVDDAGNLFTREKERTVLKRYKIIYENI